MIKTRRGISLIEALFVLGIMAIIIGAIMVLYSQSNDREKINQLKDEILTIYNISSTLTNDMSDFSNLQSSNIISSGLLDKRYIQDGHIITPLGGMITMGNYGAGVPSISLWMYGLSKSNCQLIVTTDFSGISTSLNTNGVWDSSWDYGYAKAYTPEQAVQHCNQSNNSVALNLKK